MPDAAAAPEEPGGASVDGRGVGCASSWKRRGALGCLPVRVLLTASTAGVAVDDGAITPTAELELCAVSFWRRACGGVGGVSMEVRFRFR